MVPLAIIRMHTLPLPTGDEYSIKRHGVYFSGSIGIRMHTLPLPLVMNARLNAAVFIFSSGWRGAAFIREQCLIVGAEIS